MTDAALTPTQEYIESFYHFQRACTEAMRSGRTVEQSAEENLRTLEATFAAYESVKT